MQNYCYSEPNIYALSCTRSILTSAHVNNINDNIVLIFLTS